MTFSSKESSHFSGDFSGGPSGVSTGDSKDSKVISVAIPRPVYGLFTYKLQPHLVARVRLGGWVKVPFFRSVTHAYVVESPQLLIDLPAGVPKDKLKDVIEVGGEESVLPGDVWSLCKWAHDYYFAPFGEVLNCAAPAATLCIASQTRAKAIDLSPRTPQSVTLTDEQQAVYENLNSLRKGDGKRIGPAGSSQVALLKGVTGSGKTEVYIELAKRALEENRGVLILVPEIALTPQLYQRFERGLGVPIALWHSAVANGKRRIQREHLKKGDIRVVVGARSAVFAPIQNLGLIVVDEEHDSTYKQEDRVRYQARDLAIVRGKLNQAFVLLGSATPSMESAERVREGRYHLEELRNRIAQGGLPQIETVDLRSEELIEGTQAPLAKRTLQAIQETLSAGQQVMVYLNRRGFAAFLLCKDCGHVRGCPECSVTLAVYKSHSELRCQVCGHRENVPDFCEKCQGSKLREMGAGTESLERDLPSHLQGAKVLRLDRDQVTSATRLSKILDSFRSGEANLLLGTQMLVKGHNFPGVTLVVVVLADALFRWPDFRAPERAFQVLKQVAGRAGRGEKPGRVLIQTFDPDHPVLAAVLDPKVEDSFWESEREIREALAYPPFGRLARLRFENSSKSEAHDRSMKMVRFLEGLRQRAPQSASELKPALEILGPSEAFLKRAKGIYRWDLLLKSKDVAVLQIALKEARRFCLERKWQFLADIDPYAL